MDDDQVVDVDTASALHVDACRDRSLVAWIVMRDPPDYPGKFTARLMIRLQSPYVLVSDTLAGLQEQLPRNLVWSGRQPADPPEVVEVWFNV